MKRAGRDEQNMVCFNRPVFGRHRGSLNQGKQVALHALARYLGAAALGARGDFVHLINEHNAVLLQHVQRLHLDLFLIHQFGSLFIDQQLQRFTDLQLARLPLVLAHLTEHTAQLLGHFLHSRGPHDLQGGGRLNEIDFNSPVIKLPLAQFLAKGLARCAFWLGGGINPELTSGAWYQNIQHPLFCRIFCSTAHFGHLSHTGLLHCNISQVANDGVHIFAHITYFSELGGFHFDEGSVSQTSQAPGNLGLAHTRGANHQNIFRRNFCSQAWLDLLATPAIAQGNGHSAFGLLLAHDVAVQFIDDFLRGHRRHRVTQTRVDGFNAAEESRRITGFQWCDSCWYKCRAHPQFPTISSQSLALTALCY